MNLYEIERCEAAKKAFRGKWEQRGGLHYYVFPNIINDSNFERARRDLIASMYYTFSRVKYEMGATRFRVCLRALNSQSNLNVNPCYNTFSALRQNLRHFNRFSEIVYPSKRPTFCAMFIEYSLDVLFKECYPYCPPIFSEKKKCFLLRTALKRLKLTNA